MLRGVPHDAPPTPAVVIEQTARVRVRTGRGAPHPLALRVTGTVDQLDAAAPVVDGRRPLRGQAVIRAGEIERVRRQGPDRTLAGPRTPGSAQGMSRSAPR